MAKDYADHLRGREWEVRPIALALARSLVEKHHYAAGGSNTRTYAHGLFPVGSVWEADCGGVAWWIPPTRSSAEKTFPPNWQGVLSLSRLVVLPGVPKSAPTFLLARSSRMIDRRAWPCLVTYADEWRGHDGGIYRLAGWEYLGLTQPQPVYVKDGRLVARKAGPRTRTHAEMLAMGCECLGAFPKHKYRHLTRRAKRELRAAAVVAADDAVEEP